MAFHVDGSGLKFSRLMLIHYPFSTKFDVLDLLGTFSTPLAT